MQYALVRISYVGEIDPGISYQTPNCAKLRMRTKKVGEYTDPDLLDRFCVDGDMRSDSTSEVGSCNINSW